MIIVSEIKSAVSSGGSLHCLNGVSFCAPGPPKRERGCHGWPLSSCSGGRGRFAVLYREEVYQRILAAAETGNPPLHVVEDELDAADG